MKKIKTKGIYKKYPNNLDELGLGGAIGSGLGALAGTFLLPGIGTSLGATLGGTIGGLVDQSNQLDEQNAMQKQQMDARANQIGSSNELQRRQSKDFVPNVYVNGGRLRRLVGGGPTDDYMSSWENIGTSQSKLTGELQKRNPKIPIKDILTEYGNKKDFSNKELDLYADSLINKYGDIYLKPEEVDSMAPQYYKDVNNLRSKDNISTQGTNDTKERPYFGWKSMLEKRFKQGESPYKYLSEGTQEYAMGGVIDIKGDSHTNGGIPTNQGVPTSITGEEPTEEVEGGEKLVKITKSIRDNLIKKTREGSFNGKIPQVGESYVLSKKNGTAELFNKVRNKYKLRLDKDNQPLDNVTKQGFDSDISDLIGVNEDMKQGLDEHMGNVSYVDGGKIEITPANKGKFTEWAKSHGKTVQEAAKMVMAHKDKYSSTIIKRANFAKNLAHEDGGVLSEYMCGGKLPQMWKGGGTDLYTDKLQKNYKEPYIPATEQYGNVNLQTDTPDYGPNVSANYLDSKGNDIVPTSGDWTDQTYEPNKLGYISSGIGSVASWALEQNALDKAKNNKYSYIPYKANTVNMSADEASLSNQYRESVANFKRSSNGLTTGQQNAYNAAGIVGLNKARLDSTRKLRENEALANTDILNKEAMINASGRNETNAMNTGLDTNISLQKLASNKALLQGTLGKGQQYLKDTEEGQQMADYLDRKYPGYKTLKNRKTKRSKTFRTDDPNMPKYS